MSERSIFLAALELTQPSERAAYLDQNCGTDSALRRRVEDLLAAHTASGSFMDQPAPDAGLLGDTAESPGSDFEPEKVGTLLAGRYELIQQIGLAPVAFTRSRRFFFAVRQRVRLAGGQNAACSAMMMSRTSGFASE